MPNQPRTPARSVRVPDALWHAAQARAAENGETVSDVLVRALVRYVRPTALQRAAEREAVGKNLG